MINYDPVRFCILMISAVLEKAGFGLADFALWLGGRAPAPVLAFGLINLALGVLFLVAFLRTHEIAPDVADFGGGLRAEA